MEGLDRAGGRAGTDGGSMDDAGTVDDVAVVAADGSDEEEAGIEAEGGRAAPCSHGFGGDAMVVGK